MAAGSSPASAVTAVPAAHRAARSPAPRRVAQGRGCGSPRVSSTTSRRRAGTRDTEVLLVRVEDDCREGTVAERRQIWLLHQVTAMFAQEPLKRDRIHVALAIGPDRAPGFSSPIYACCRKLLAQTICDPPSPAAPGTHRDHNIGRLSLISKRGRSVTRWPRRVKALTNGPHDRNERAICAGYTDDADTRRASEIISAGSGMVATQKCGKCERAAADLTRQACRCAWSAASPPATDRERPRAVAPRRPHAGPVPARRPTSRAA